MFLLDQVNLNADDEEDLEDDSQNDEYTIKDRNDFSERGV